MNRPQPFQGKIRLKRRKRLNILNINILKWHPSINPMGQSLRYHFLIYQYIYSVKNSKILKSTEKSQFSENLAPTNSIHSSQSASKKSPANINRSEFIYFVKQLSKENCRAPDTKYADDRKM